VPDSLLDGALAGLQRLAIRTPFAALFHRIDLRGPDLAIIKVNGTGKTGKIRPTAAASLHGSHNPVVAARIVIEGGPSKDNVLRAEAIHGLTPNGVLADPHRLIGGEPPADRAIPVVPPIAILWDGRAAPVIPCDIEGVPFGAALRILDSNHGGATAPPIPNQLLPAAAVDAAESEARRICGHRRRAFESAPLGRLPGAGT